MRLIVVGLLLFVTHAFADTSTMRCGVKLVSLGERGFSVQRKCGKPDDRYLVGYKDEGGIPVEEWVYNISGGSPAPYYLLRFEGGKLVNIKSQFPTN